MQWSRLHCVFLFKTTTMFWHDNNDVFKDNRDNRDNL